MQLLSIKSMSSNMKQTLGNSHSVQGDPKNSTENFNNNNTDNEINGTWSVLKKQVRWALDMVAKKEQLTMPIFATKFGYHSEDYAHSAYSDLITSSN
ncbi:hypothetical protein BGZ47_005976 [Haplosporangium gracile]|nr:hypothetical protein BGZ47_005976 [Haplosporangium gracile]